MFLSKLIHSCKIWTLRMFVIYTNTSSFIVWRMMRSYQVKTGNLIAINAFRRNIIAVYLQMSHSYKTLLGSWIKFTIVPPNNSKTLYDHVVIHILLTATTKKSLWLFVPITGVMFYYQEHLVEVVQVRNHCYIKKAMPTAPKYWLDWPASLKMKGFPVIKWIFQKNSSEYEVTSTNISTVMTAKIH